VARLRLGLRVVIGARKQKDLLWLQSLAHHAHQVLAQPVQVGLLAQPSGKILRPNRTGAMQDVGYGLPRIHLLGTSVNKGRWMRWTALGDIILGV
jgi:hypothetical protein